MRYGFVCIFGFADACGLLAFLPRHVRWRSAGMVDFYAFAHHSAISGDVARAELMFILYPIASNLSPDARKDINNAPVALAGDRHLIQPGSAMDCPALAGEQHFIQPWFLGTARPWLASSVSSSQGSFGATRPWLASGVWFSQGLLGPAWPWLARGV